MSEGKHRKASRRSLLVAIVAVLSLCGVAAIAAGFASREEAPPSHVPLPPATSSQTDATAAASSTSDSTTSSSTTEPSTSTTKKKSSAASSTKATAKSSDASKPGSSTAETTTTPKRTTSRRAAPPQSDASVGGTISIPALGVSNTTIGPTCAVDNGVLEPPTNRNGMLCHWAGSSTRSMYTIAGHINYSGYGQGALGRLYDLRAGDHITTSIGGAKQTWTVTKVWSRTKSQGVDPVAFAGDNGPKTLALVTCGGTLHSGNYDHNIYALAVPA